MRAGATRRYVKPNAFYTINKTVAGIFFPEVSKSAVVSELSAGKPLDGKIIEHPLYWYFTTIHNAFCELFDTSIVDEYWTVDSSMKPEDYTEAYVNEFLEALEVLAADNIAHHCFASQILNVINFGKLDDITDWLVSLSIPRKFAANLSARGLIQEEAIEDLASIGSEHFFQEDMLPYLYERHVAQRGHGWDQVLPDHFDIARKQVLGLDPEADDEEDLETPQPAQDRPTVPLFASLRGNRPRTKVELPAIPPGQVIPIFLTI